MKEKEKNLKEIKVDVLGESNRNNFPNSFIELPSIYIYSIATQKLVTSYDRIYRYIYIYICYNFGTLRKYKSF